MQLRQQWRTFQQRSGPARLPGAKISSCSLFDQLTLRTMTTLPNPDDLVFTLSDMDPSVSPGSDFYQFANGGWLESNPVPDDYPRWAAFDEVRVANENLLHGLFRAAADASGEPRTAARWCGVFYRAGMDTAAIESAGLSPIQPLLDRIDEVESVTDLSEAASEFLPLGLALPIGGGVVPDFDDSSRHLLYLSSGGMGLPERDYYFREDEQSERLREQYLKHIETMLDLSGHAKPDVAAEKVLTFETALAEFAYTAAQQRDMDLVLNRRAVSELDDLMPHFGLIGFLERFGATDIQAVNVANPGFFAAADDLLAQSDIPTLRAWARWQILSSTASSLTSAFEEEAFRFYGQILGGQKQQRERWKRVLRAASADLDQLVAQLYVEEAFSPEAKARAEEMVGHIIESMRRAIAGLTWMSEDTKHAATRKLDGFVAKLGYPDEWRDYSSLDLGHGPYASVRLAARRFEFDRKLKELHEPVNPHEWEMGAHEVNAYYHPLRNEIVFPAGILQPPFFQADADDAVNYGGIGAVIGHEITHGFDDMGSRFDASGNFANWWSEHDREEFERRAQVLVDQFAQYEPLDGLFVNGELTLGENIADLGGVTIAYDALQDALARSEKEPVGGLTPEQRFFLAYARVWRTNSTEEHLRLAVQTDPHAPGQYRCNGPLGNLEAFAKAFNLPNDAGIMRPEDQRAKVW